MKEFDGDTAKSYYEHSRNLTIDAPPLEGDARAEVVVIGGGITGCSSALHLAQEGIDVVLVESRHIGWGASGRSGGQIINGYACEPKELEKLLGQENARVLWQHSLNAVDYTRELVRKHDIDCDLKMGYMYVAESPAKAAQLERMVPYMAQSYDYNNLEYLDRNALSSQLESKLYHGAVTDSGSGHLHPLNYCLGVGKAAQDAGTRMFQRTTVTRIESRSGKKTVHCAAGRISCDQVVLGCNAYLDGLAPAIDKKIMPVGTYIIATEPLGAERADRLVPNRVAISDTNFVLDYYRLSGDNRMLFGGRVSYSSLEPVRLADSLRNRMLRVFPGLDDVEIDFSWGGYVAITQNRGPHVGQMDDGSWFAHGYSGHGMALTGYIGKILADAIRGDSSDIECFTKIPHRSFPGGKLLRTPMLVAAMAYFRLKDLLPK